MNIDEAKIVFTLLGELKGVLKILDNMKTIEHPNPIDYINDIEFLRNNVEHIVSKAVYELDKMKITV